MYFNVTSEPHETNYNCNNKFQLKLMRKIKLIENLIELNFSSFHIIKS